MTAQNYKLIFTGTMGAGKTTAIAAISEIPPIRTDVDTSESQHVSKTTTTAAFDYGEVSLPQGDVLRLYGTPGQTRFSFMWNILSEGALGVIVLVDNSRPDPVQDMRDYVDAFRDVVGRSRAVIGIGRMDSHPAPDIDAYYEAIMELGLDAPILSIDVRRREDVLMMLDVLFHQVEAAEAESAIDMAGAV
jgi:signal recognition particle receptor subunit beta